MKVLINRSDAIGDLLLTLPFLKTIKKNYPQCQIGLLISPRTKELVTLFPHLIDQYWVIDKKDSFLRKYNFLQEVFGDFEPTHYFYIGGDTTANMVALLKRVPFRGGLVSKVNTFFTLNNGIRQVRSLAEMHEADYNLELLRPLNEELKIDKEIQAQLKEVDGALVTFKKELVAAGLDPEKKWVFIHPGMTGHTLNWPLENYGELVSQLAEQNPDLIFIISYTPGDMKYIEGFKSSLPEGHALPIFYFDGSTKGLVHYSKILSNASLFVGPSTGTTHMANLLGICQIAFYSPIKVQSALRWGPLRQDNRVQIMDPVVECPELKKCAGESCKDYFCMTRIAIDQALNHARQFLA